MEKEIHELISNQENYLTTIIGIGNITAAVIMAEVGDISRFKRSNQLLAFVGLDFCSPIKEILQAQKINYLNVVRHIFVVPFGKSLLWPHLKILPCLSITKC